MAADNSKVEVKIRIPGPQNFTSEQREALDELLSDLRAEGYEATRPIRKTASTTIAVLTMIGLWLGEKLADKTFDVSVDKLLEIGIDWAKRQFKRNPRDDGEPPRTTTIVIYGPDDQPLREVEVTEDDDDSTDFERPDG